ncbi:MAG: lamin tail domain-containing protein, partial [Candidatus Cloacimonetes bacterium]|nr:lamin tail domain-containing protein [Candidatus Cloacimonadota bacterium]
MKKIGLLFVLVLLCSSMVYGQIISQYIETDSGTSPKGIEIWNNTSSTLDFSANNLVIEKGVNGGTPSADYTLSSGSLASGEVIVIGTSDLQTTTENNGSTFYEKSFTFNGDDALVVKYGGTTTDAFGDPGSDPGASWSGNGVSTENQNIKLKSGISTGDTNGWTDPSVRFETVNTNPSGTNGDEGFGIAPTGGDTPTIIVDPSSLSGFSYVEGNGPSAEQTFTIEGTNLTDDISITAPTNYEISETSGSGFGSPITLPQTGGSVGLDTIYVRLKAGLSAGDYNNEDITCSSSGASSKIVTCNGSVTGELPETGDVVINEIGEPYEMSGIWQDSYIELYNNTAEDIDISNWVINSVEAKGKATSSFTFPPGTTIKADSFIVATRNRDNFLADYGTYIDTNIVPIASATTGTGVYIKNGYYFSLETNTGS